MRAVASLRLVLALGLSLSAASAQAAPDSETGVVYSMGARAPLAFFLHYASEGSVTTGDTSGVLTAFDRALARDTGLVRMRLTEGLVAKCAEDFTVLDLCVFHTLYPTLDFSQAGVDLPGPHEAAAQALATVSAPRLVFNLSVAQVRGRKDVQLRVFSSTTAAAALARAQTAARAEGASMDAFELQSVLTSEVVKVVRRVEVDNLADDRLYRDLIRELGGLVAGFVAPGELVVRAEDLPPGALILLDGQELGPVGEGGARVVDVRPGVHTLGVQAEGYDSAELGVTVSSGSSVELKPTLRSQSARIAWDVARYGGLAITAAGVGLMIASAALGGNATCHRLGDGGECPDPSLVGTGGQDLSAKDPTLGAPMFAIGGAVAGVGLLLTGASFVWGGD